MKNKTNASLYVALAFLVGSLSAAGCSVSVPVNPAPQASEQSQTTTTTRSIVPAPVVSTTTDKTTTTKSSTY